MVQKIYWISRDPDHVGGNYFNEIFKLKFLLYKELNVQQNFILNTTQPKNPEKQSNI